MVLYDVNLYSPLCADRLLSAFEKPDEFCSPVIDTFYWENIDFLSAVKDASNSGSYHDAAYVRFKRACEFGQVPIPSGIEFSKTIVDYHFLISDRAHGVPVPSGLGMPERAKELVSIVSALKSLSDE